MFSTPVYRTLNALLTVIIACFLASALAAPTPDQALINGASNPMSANSGITVGHCDAQKPLLNAAFQEAIDMAKTAVRAIDRVKLGRDNWIAFSDEARISKSLQAIFGIKTGTFREPMAERDAGRLEGVVGLYRNVVEFGGEGDEGVEVSCDDECRLHVVLSKYTGSGSQTTTFCPRAYLSSLMAFKTNQDAIPSNTHIDTYRSSLPVTLLRELVHLVGQDLGVGKADGFSYADCAFLARDRPDMAIGNADNYAYFALSVWPDEVDWANGFAQKRPDTDDDGRGEREEHDNNDNDILANGEAGVIGMEQAQRAREMIDAMTKPQLEYQANGLPKPTKHSSFVAVGQDEVAEL